MKEIAVVSGKGGTGKTTLVGSLESLFSRTVMVDCDVDASNLHLLFQPEKRENFQFYGGKKARIDPELCTGCGDCESVCRFEAIFPTDEEIFDVDPYTCEGCKACVFACLFEAIALEENQVGSYFLSTVGEKRFVHAHLNPGEENSGGLVAEVRKLAHTTGESENADFLLIDGAPGIGCPATSSIIGVNYVISIAEPTQTGLHDLKRMVKTIKQYEIPTGVVVNKYDLNPVITQEILDYCSTENLDLLGKIPFDPAVVKALMHGIPVIKYKDSKAAEAIRDIYKAIVNRIR